MSRQADQVIERPQPLSAATVTLETDTKTNQQLTRMLRYDHHHY